MNQKEYHRKYKRQWFAKLTAEQKAKYREQHRKYKRQWFAKLTAEQKAKYREQHRQYKKQWFAKLTAEQKAKYREQQRKQQRQWVKNKAKCYAKNKQENKQYSLEKIFYYRLRLQNMSAEAKEKRIQEKKTYEMKLFENIKKVIKENVKKPLKITTCFDHFDEIKAKWRERGRR